MCTQISIKISNMGIVYLKGKVMEVLVIYGVRNFYAVSERYGFKTCKKA